MSKRRAKKTRIDSGPIVRHNRKDNPEVKASLTFGERRPQSSRGREGKRNLKKIGSRRKRLSLFHEREQRKEGLKGIAEEKTEPRLELKTDPEP